MCIGKKLKRPGTGGLSMSDYISRDEIFSVWRSMPKPASISSLTDAINRTPAADVEPVRNVRIREGEEQYVEDFGWFRWDYCLNCGSGFNITGHLRYCPYCGGKAVLESGPPIPLEHVEATDEEAEEFFHATKEAVAKFCGGCGAKMCLEDETNDD